MFYDSFMNYPINEDYIGINNTTLIIAKFS